MISIDPEVTEIARDYGVDAALIQAVEKAEGNILTAVRCSFPNTADRTEALRITCRSALHALYDFHFTAGIPLAERTPARFVAFWGARWAPLGVVNDPHGLNANWVRNVTIFWLGDVATPTNI